MKIVLFSMLQTMDVCIKAKKAFVSVACPNELSWLLACVRTCYGWKRGSQSHIVSPFARLKTGLEPEASSRQGEEIVPRKIPMQQLCQHPTWEDSCSCHSSRCSRLATVHTIRRSEQQWDLTLYFVCTKSERKTLFSQTCCILTTCLL